MYMCVYNIYIYIHIYIYIYVRARSIDTVCLAAAGNQHFMFLLVSVGLRGAAGSGQKRHSAQLCSHFHSASSQLRDNFAGSPKHDCMLFCVW